ncbi:MAG: hypothetical protein GEU93_14005 [Propionibacteriales bacterium]|nr:hypothetical protein [Propionibacteriales bacterium]
MFKQIIGGAVATAALAAGGMGVSQADTQPPNLVCDGTVDGGTYKRVTVPKGESCRLVDATVKSVRARGAHDVRILDTDVRRNLMVAGSTGTTKIGNAGECSYDPAVANNIVVRGSHHVLVCQMSVGNNLTIRRNDGRITVRDNTVDNNLKVNRNLAYDGNGSVRHRDPDAIRIRGNDAGNHIMVFGNDSSRNLRMWDNTPKPRVKK